MTSHCRATLRYELSDRHLHAVGTAGLGERRILPVDADVADVWGRLMAGTRTVPAVDSLIAATALHHRLTIVTRNEADFAATGVDLLNP